MDEVKSARLPNPKRPDLPTYSHQIDLYWETGDSIAHYFNVANAKWRGADKVDQGNVLLPSAGEGKMAAHKALMITSVGFTEGAIAAAKDDGIALHVVEARGRMDNDEEIKSLQSFLRIVDASRSRGRAGALPARVFRGQPADRPLLPRFAREASRRQIPEVVATERRLLDDFSRLALPYLGYSRPRDAFEWMAVAQHYGVPTRLLDWTGNPLFALWFAVRGRPKEDGAFWVLSATDEHLLPLEMQDDVYGLNRTYLFRPAHITSRIVAQDGWFTVHWYIERKNKFVPLEQQSRFSDHLKRYLIPTEAFPKLRTGLARLGISDSVLFPDLESLSKELVSRVFPKSGT